MTAETREKSPFSVEKRAIQLPAGELRVERRDDGSSMIVGYAAVYDSLSEDLGGFREKIAPGFFAPMIGRADCRALVNHNPDRLLGRTTSGTLRLFDDARGLRFENDVPGTQVGRDAAEEIARRDMDGCSFSFVADVDEWDWSGAVPIRTLRVCRDLYDVGPVVYPAYTATSVSARALEIARVGDPALIEASRRRRQEQRLLKLRLSLRHR